MGRVEFKRRAVPRSSGTEGEESTNGVPHSLIRAKIEVEAEEKHEVPHFLSGAKVDSMGSTTTHDQLVLRRRSSVKIRSLKRNKKYHAPSVELRLKWELECSMKYHTPTVEIKWMVWG